MPAGNGVPEVAVASQFEVGRVRGWNDGRRYALTLWTPTRVAPGSTRWVPHVLIRASPFPIAERDVRLADVTGDGHDDLLVTVMCSTCNHSTAAVSIYAHVRGAVRRVYGVGFLSAAQAPGRRAGVQGRVIGETPWGARNSLVWFDLPGGGTSVCCPAYRLHVFLRWTGHGWHTVARTRVFPGADTLLRQGYPPP